MPTACPQHRLSARALGAPRCIRFVRRSDRRDGVSNSRAAGGAVEVGPRHGDHLGTVREQQRGVVPEPLRETSDLGACLAHSRPLLSVSSRTGRPTAPRSDPQTGAAPWPAPTARAAARDPPQTLGGRHERPGRRPPGRRRASWPGLPRWPGSGCRASRRLSPPPGAADAHPLRGALRRCRSCHSHAPSPATSTSPGAPMASVVIPKSSAALDPITRSEEPGASAIRVIRPTGSSSAMS
jgi:hypothetical protein